jgi:hypothetical protein
MTVDLTMSSTKPWELAADLTQWVVEKFTDIIQVLGIWKEEEMVETFLLQNYRFQSWAYSVGLSTLLGTRRPLHDRLNTDVANDVCNLLKRMQSTMLSINQASRESSMQILPSVMQILQDIFLRLSAHFPDKDGAILKHIIAHRIIQPEDSFRELGQSPCLRSLPDVETMAAMKRISLLIQQSEARTGSDKSLLIDFQKELKLDKTKSLLVSSGMYTKRYSPHRRQSSQVLVEWKSYEGLWDTEIGNQLFERVELLAQFLQIASQSSSTLNLRLLECLGYCHDDSRNRLGFVFDIPASISDRKSFLRLKNLLNAYHEQKSFPPSVDDRVRIARSLCRAMFEFHSSEWFHKGFTSSHIIIFSEVEDTRAKDSDEPLNVKNYSILAPYIIGFNYSRPSKPNEFSEPSKISEESRRYQHPDYKNIPMQKYRHEYDYYSLGMVLLEIGQWRPLGVIMNGKTGFDQLDAKAFANEIKEIHCAHLGSFISDKYARVVLSLLQSFEEDRLNLQQNELIDPGKLLQFHTDILESLETTQPNV